MPSLQQLPLKKNKLSRFIFGDLTISKFATKVLAEWEILLSLNSLTWIYSICSDIPVLIFSEVLHHLGTILNIYLLVRLNSYLCDRKSKNIHAMTTGYISMNQMLQERYQSQVSLCKNEYIYWHMESLNCNG